MVTNFFGKRGSGKTHTIKGQLQDLEGPVVVIDFLGNFTAYDPDNNPDGIKDAVEVDSDSEAIEKIEDYANNPEENPKIIIVQTFDPTMTVDFMCLALWEIEGGTLVLDETDAFDIHAAKNFDKVVRYGRNKNIHLITGVRRPAEIPKNITAAANKVYAFKTHEPRDVEYFEKTLFGQKAEELLILPDYSGIFIDYDKKIMGNFRVDEHGIIFHTKEMNF